MSPGLLYTALVGLWLTGWSKVLVLTVSEMFWFTWKTKQNTCQGQFLPAKMINMLSLQKYATIPAILNVENQVLQFRHESKLC